MTESLPFILWAGAALALVAVLLLVYQAGRRAARRTPGLAEVERGLRALAEGEYLPRLEIDAADPAADAGAGLAVVARRLREAQAEAAAAEAAAAASSGVAAAPAEPAAPAPAEPSPAELWAAALASLEGRGVVLLDHDLAFVSANEGAAALFGARPGELAGRSVQELLAPESFRELAAAVAESRRGRAPFSARLALAGTRACARTLAAHGGWPAAPPECVALLLEDVSGTEVRASGDESAALYERYWSILAGLPDAVLVVADGRVQEANARALSWLGTRVAGAAFKNLVGAEDVLLVLDRVARAADGETVEPVECRLQPVEEGLREREVELFAAPVRAGGRRGAALLLRDLSSERRLDRRARISDARLLAVLDGAADALLLLAPPVADGAPWRVALVNRPLCELFGLDAAAVSGAPEREFRALVAHRFQDPAALVALFEEAAREPERVLEAALELTGGERTVEVSLRPIAGSEGELAGRLVVARDITHHRSAERQLVEDAAALGRSRDALQRSYEQLAAVHRDLEKKSSELDRLNRELVEIDRARAQLHYDLSHALHTPLISIRGYCQMVIEGRLGKVNDEQRRGLEIALRNVDRMVELIANMLALATSEAPGPPRTQPLDPAAILTAVAERHQAEAERQGVRIELEIGEPGAEVAADRDGLTQVFDNLVGNAVKFNREGGRVVVSAQPGPAGFMKFEVADTGIGIPPEEQERIFERFYRGRGAAGTTGAGIGLATVKNIVAKHGGAIEVDSTVGHGTTFRLLWPRQPIPAPGGTAASAAAG